MNYNIEDRTAIVNSVDRLVENLEKIKGKNCLNGVTNTVSDNQIQNLIYLLALDGSDRDKTISKIILSECNRAESISSGSAILVLNLLSYYILKNRDSNTRKKRLESIKSLRSEILESSIIMSKFCLKPEKKDLFRIISNLNLPVDLSQSLTSLIEEYNIGERVEVKKGDISKTTIFEKRGNFLPIEIPQALLGGKSKWEFDNVKTLLIDGIIEEVSQIHHLLESASSEKEPYMIICRKVSKEVRETIDVNFLRGTLNLVLIETDFDVMYHHLFRDMSVIFDCDFINVQMGDSLSSRIKKFLFKIDKVRLDSSGMNLYHDNSSDENIRKYLKDIRKSIQNISDIDSESSEKISKSIQIRSKFLSSNTKILSIGKSDLDEKRSEISKIDSFMRSIPAIGSLGVIDLKDIKTENRIIDSIKDTADSSIVTQSQVFYSLITSYKIYEMICRAEKLFTIAK